jgi:hypothetical protein
METTNYTIGQEFSITEKTGNQSIYKMIIKSVETIGDVVIGYGITCYMKNEMVDGSIKKSQATTKYNKQALQYSLENGYLVEKN